MTPVNAVIIDDEPDSIRLLKLQIGKHCPGIRIIADYTRPQQALKDMEMLQPDLLLLDIEMPAMNGFEFLERLMPLSFHVIFVTAYNQYALKAFRFNALDYLVKPVDTQELKAAIGKLTGRTKPTAAQIGLLHRQLHGEPARKIAIPGQNGISFISLDEIVYAEASNNYTILILGNGKKILISKTLKEIQLTLEESHFVRIHRQYIINLNHVVHYNRNAGMLTMNDNAELPVARSQREKLVERYGWL